MDEYEYPKVQRVYSSPMKRCIETAEIIYPYRELQIVENMTELDFGEFDGKSVQELIDRDDYKEWLKGGTPVSYTHLDVYKRQYYSRTHSQT